MIATAATPAHAAPPAAVQTLALAPGHDAGSVGALGGRGRGLDIKKLLLFGIGGAALGAVVPVIPGGPLGGALIGAALEYFL